MQDFSLHVQSKCVPVLIRKAMTRATVNVVNVCPKRTSKNIGMQGELMYGNVTFKHQKLSQKS